ncbi:MAG: hypothetical protein Q9227_002028 [Pyrenula ochraceoflavens]
MAFPAIERPITPLPITPPDPDPTRSLSLDVSLIPSALHVISNQRKAVTYLESLYRSDEAAQKSLVQAIALITSTISRGGKVIFVGVGKSGKVAEKLVATFTIPADIVKNDVVLMLTFSGKTPELLLLAQHLPSVPLIIMTSCRKPADCTLTTVRPDGVLLPSPIHEPEQVSFGHSAPTTSTTVAMVLGDALALVTAEYLHNQANRRTVDVFLTNHPGGAIGQQFSRNARCMQDIAIPVDSIPIASPKSNSSLKALDVVLTAVRSPRGWVRIDHSRLIAPRAVQTLCDMEEEINAESKRGLSVEKTDWISVLGSSSVKEVKGWIKKMRSEPRGRTFLKHGTILGVVDNCQEVSAVLEIEDVAADLLEA